jgi:hypothetical protein
MSGTVNERNSVPQNRESRADRTMRELFMLLERREELRGVYAPADQLADTVRWSA